MLEARDRNGRFVNHELNYRVREGVAYIAIWQKEQIIRAIFDVDDLQKLIELGSLVLRAGYVCCKHRLNGKPGEHNRKFEQVSRIITNCPDGMVVDHINGDALDNRKSNLRIVTQLQNCQNRPRLNKNNSSGARGVVGERYSVALSVDGIRRNFGTFDNIEDAAKVVEQVSGRKIRPANKQSKTGMRGINVIRPKAWIAINGKRHYLGSFDTVEEAEEAVKQKLKTQ